MNMWELLGISFALSLVLEGLLPFLSPQSFRQSLQTLSELDDKSLRLIGLISMVIGVVILYMVH